MSNINDEKYNKLCDYLKSLKKVAVAYSSGVDSTFLLKVAFDTLGADEDAQITVGLEEDCEYSVSINDKEVGKMKTNLGGKLNFSVDLSAGRVKVEIKK